MSVNIEVWTVGVLLSRALRASFSFFTIQATAAAGKILKVAAVEARKAYFDLN